jgi:chromate transporter
MAPTTTPQKSEKGSCLQLFGVFFGIGFFTFGGGYAMIPIIEEDVVRHYRWLTPQDFIDLLAVAQSLPGVFAVNIAIAIGYRMQGVRGAVIAAFGAILPSFGIILCLALLFHYGQEDVYVRSVLTGLRPAAVALIASPVFTLGRTANITWRTVWIPACAALAIWLLGFSPIWVIVLAGGGGYLWGVFQNKRKD